MNVYDFFHALFFFFLNKYIQFLTYSSAKTSSQYQDGGLKPTLIACTPA